jgi:regulator of nonsense transcripts 3
MSVAEPKRNQAKQKQKDPKPQAAPNGTERLKTVVRRLPPNLPEDIFWQSVQPWVTDDSTSWKVFYAGKLRKRWAFTIVCVFAV